MVHFTSTFLVLAVIERASAWAIWPNGHPHPLRPPQIITCTGECELFEHGVRTRPAHALHTGSWIHTSKASLSPNPPDERLWQHNTTHLAAYSSRPTWISLPNPSTPTTIPTFLTQPSASSPSTFAVPPAVTTSPKPTLSPSPNPSPEPSPRPSAPPSPSSLDAAAASSIISSRWASLKPTYTPPSWPTGDAAMALAVGPGGAQNSYTFEVQNNLNENVVLVVWGIPKAVPDYSAPFVLNQAEPPKLMMAIPAGGTGMFSFGNTVDVVGAWTFLSDKTTKNPAGDLANTWGEYSLTTLLSSGNNFSGLDVSYIRASGTYDAMSISTFKSSSDTSPACVSDSAGCSYRSPVITECTDGTAVAAFDTAGGQNGLKSCVFVHAGDPSFYGYAKVVIG